MELLHISYREVLEATKHEDAKVGRFLAAIAFLVAGALAFVPSEVLKTSYDVGDSVLALPAILMALFLGLTVISVLLLILAIGTPLTFPSTSDGQDITGSRQHSHIFFGLIERERDFDQWRRRWETLGLQSELRSDYLHEIYHLARRTSNKRNRVVEGVTVFAAALLCFGLLVGLGVDSLSRDANRSTPTLSLTLDDRIPLLVGACVYSGVLLYHRLRQGQIRRPVSRANLWFWLLAIGTWLTLLALGLPAEWSTAGRWLMAGVALAGTAMAAVAAFALPDKGAGKAVAVAVVLLLGGASAVVIAVGDEPVQLLLVLVIAVSPLLTQLFTSIAETHRQKRLRRLDAGA